MLIIFLKGSDWIKHDKRRNISEMITIKGTKKKIEQDKQHWLLHLMDFVDDFRYYKDSYAVEQPIECSDEKIDAMLASTNDYLCSELKLEYPKWSMTIPAVKDPWFVSGIENLKAISLVESPLHFRKRKIFVLENFMQRV